MDIGISPRLTNKPQWCLIPISLPRKMNWNNPYWSLFIAWLASLTPSLFDVLSLSLLLPWKNKEIYHTWNSNKHDEMYHAWETCFTGNPYKITIVEGHENFLSARSTSEGPTMLNITPLFDVLQVVAPAGLQLHLVLLLLLFCFLHVGLLFWFFFWGVGVGLCLFGLFCSGLGWGFFPFFFFFGQKPKLNTGKQMKRERLAWALCQSTENKIGLPRVLLICKKSTIHQELNLSTFSLPPHHKW